MNLTISDIKKDISEFRARIQAAQDEIDALPTGRLPFKEHRKREKIRRDCKVEIKHVRQLIVYAREGIELRKKDFHRHKTNTAWLNSLE